MKKFFLTITFLLCVKAILCYDDEFVKQLRCLVCQTALDELDQAVGKLDPNKKVSVGGYRLDAKGNLNVKTVQQSKSEVVISDLIDDICDKMEDYVRATWKSNGQLTLLQLIDKNGQMNPDMSRVDIIQDSDLNKSLKFYCEGIMEEHEDSIIKHYQDNSDNMDYKICTKEAKYCSHSAPEPEDRKIAHEDEL